MNGHSKKTRKYEKRGQIVKCYIHVIEMYKYNKKSLGTDGGNPTKKYKFLVTSHFKLFLVLIQEPYF